MKEKVYGKQKIYYPDQSGFKEVSADELNAMEKEIENMEAKLRQAESEIKEAQNELKYLVSEVTTEELKSNVEKVRSLKNFQSI